MKFGFTALLTVNSSQLTKTNEDHESESDWKTTRASWYSVRGHSRGSDGDQRTAAPTHAEVGLIQ